MRHDPHQQLALLRIEVETADVVPVDDDPADGAIEEERRGESEAFVREGVLDEPRVFAGKGQRAARPRDRLRQFVAG